MIIQENPLRHWINHFYGYGSWQSKIWFIAYEDGGGDLPEEVAEKLNYFYTSCPDVSGPALVDIRKFYRQFSFHWNGPKAGEYKNHYEYRFGANAIQNGVWKNLIAFAHGFRNSILPDLLEYQKHAFAKHEALIKLFPMPSPHHHAWYYSWLDAPKFPFLKRREQYESQLFGPRLKNILHYIVTHKPELVLMYGMNNIKAIKDVVLQFLPGVSFTSYKAIKLQIPQYHHAYLNDTQLLITTQIPALRHNRIETGFDWYKFGQSVKKSAL